METTTEQQTATFIRVDWHQGDSFDIFKTMGDLESTYDDKNDSICQRAMEKAEEVEMNRIEIEELEDNAHCNCPEIEYLLTAFEDEIEAEVFTVFRHRLESHSLGEELTLFGTFASEEQAFDCLLERLAEHDNEKYFEILEMGYDGFKKEYGTEIGTADATDLAIVKLTHKYYKYATDRSENLTDEQLYNNIID